MTDNTTAADRLAAAWAEFSEAMKTNAAKALADATAELDRARATPAGPPSTWPHEYHHDDDHDDETKDETKDETFVAGHMPVEIMIRFGERPEHLGHLELPVVHAAQRPHGAIPFDLQASPAQVLTAAREALGLDDDPRD